MVDKAFIFYYHPMNQVHVKIHNLRRPLLGFLVIISARVFLLAFFTKANRNAHSSYRYTSMQILLQGCSGGKCECLVAIPS